VLEVPAGDSFRFLRTKTVDVTTVAAQLPAKPRLGSRDESGDDGRQHNRNSAGIDWIAAARAGDEAAFEELYRDTQPRLLRYAASLVGQDATDVTAEAWLQIARDLGRFTGDRAAFRAWSARIVRNRALDLLRAQARRPIHEADLSILMNQPDSADTAVMAADNISTKTALAMINTLPQDQAEAVLLRAVVGLDAAAAGQVLGKSAGAVRVAAHRGLKALARSLDQRPEVSPTQPDLV
jgi:RNA polymerase sigma-70 factor (ECF subfamily)